MRKSSVFLGRREAPLFSRFGARAIDLLITVALFLIGRSLWPWLGPIAAGLYAALADSFGLGQSLGKRIIGLRVVEEHSGLPCSAQASLLRNLVVVGMVVGASHFLLWLPGILFFVPAAALELYLCLGLDSAVRLGDVLGNTTVQEALEWAPGGPGVGT